MYSLVESFRRIEDNTVDVYAVSSVQEEVGVRGVPSAVRAIEAGTCVAIDGSLPSDIPFARPYRDLLRGLMQTCEKHGIPYQRNLGGGRDASAVHAFDRPDVPCAHPGDRRSAYVLPAVRPLDPAR